jgi:hypothetical protein
MRIPCLICYVCCVTPPSQAVAYNRDEFVRRKFRVMNLLADMFDNADWIILHSPFIYTAGVTKSVALCDVRRILWFHCNRRVRS